METTIWFFEFCEREPLGLVFESIPSVDDLSADLDAFVPKLGFILFDAGEKAAFELSLTVSFATVFDPNGMGALLGIGGKAAFVPLLVGAFETDFAPNGVGALLDMGGNTAFELLADVFATDFAPN